MPFQPILLEYLAEIAAGTGRSVDDPSLEELEAAVRANEALLSRVDAADRSPSDDPSDFLALLRAWREKA